MQIFPGGAVLQVKGESCNPDFRVKFQNDKKFRRPKEDELRSIIIQERAERYAEREIFACDSCLVSELIQHAYDLPKDLQEAFDMSGGDFKNLRPDPSDWDLEKCKDWLEDHGHDLPDPNPWGMSREERIEDLQSRDPEERDDSKTTDEQLLEHILDLMADTDIDAYRDAVNDNAEDAEVYEWWRCSSWLACQLEKIGEVVLDNGYGHWWGRCCTGQSMLMDGTLQEVAAMFD